MATPGWRHGVAICAKRVAPLFLLRKGRLGDCIGLFKRSSSLSVQKTQDERSHHCRNDGHSHEQKCSKDGMDPHSIGYICRKEKYKKPYSKQYLFRLCSLNQQVQQWTYQEEHTSNMQANETEG